MKFCFFDPKIIENHDFDIQWRCRAESATAPFFSQRARSQLGELVECMEARSIIEPAEREHGGRALRGNLHAKLENQRNLEELVLRLQS